MNRVGIEPDLLRWARERSGKSTDDLRRRFPRLEEWERGAVLPTFRQVEDFAKATHTPIGFLFLTEPPVEALPLPDFRTVGDVAIRRPSPDLLDTIYLCQQRQEWYREEARIAGEPPLEFVGSLDTTTDPPAAAGQLGRALGFDVEHRGQMSTWSEALRQFIAQADGLGVLVMVSGIVGSNTHRQLDPAEFRGFTLADAVAPLVFINGADTKAAQMFTLAHELCHVWLGESGVSNAPAESAPDHRVERWCNEVAAELLAPAELVRAEFAAAGELSDVVQRLARRCKVSRLVAIRRLHDVGALGWEEFRAAYREELARLDALPPRSGGNAVRNVSARAGKRLTRTLIASALEGRTSYTEAYRLLGVRKQSSFERIAESLGMGV